MGKKLQLYNQNKKTGFIEIKNQTEETADLYLYGDIIGKGDDWYVEDVCPADVAIFLSQLSGVKSIHVHINSGGGAVFAGIAIGNQLKDYEAEIIGHIEGLAASTAGVIAMYVDRLIMHPGSMFMMHKPLTGIWGNAADLRKTADTLDQCQKTILSMYMSKTKEGISEKTIEDMINAETWLTAEDMQKYFNVELADGMPIAACDSQFYDKYMYVPDHMKKQPQNNVSVNIDVDKIADALLQRLENKNKSEENEKQKEIENILADLDYI